MNSKLSKQKIPNNIFEIGFRVHTVGLLTEIADAGLRDNSGVLKVPLNTFRSLLCNLTERASEINDPQLNIWMLSLGLYEVPYMEIPDAIENQIKLAKKLNQKS